MPAEIAVANATEQSMSRMSGRQLCYLAAALLAAGVLVWVGMQRSRGGGLKVPARATEDVLPFTPPPHWPIATTDQLAGGYVFTPHRYPRVCGNEVSAMINGGHATWRLPHQKDISWFTAPPGEVTL